jgi:hypothetical protein
MREMVGGAEGDRPWKGRALAPFHTVIPSHS